MFEAFVHQFAIQISAPLEARIAELEKKLEEVNGFEDRVLEVIANNPSTVVDHIEDELKDRSDDDDLESKVRGIINNGSFSLDFTP
jgi:hypothetical protein